MISFLVIVVFNFGLLFPAVLVLVFRLFTRVFECDIQQVNWFVHWYVSFLQSKQYYERIRATYHPPICKEGQYGGVDTTREKNCHTRLAMVFPRLK